MSLPKHWNGVTNSYRGCFDSKIWWIETNNQLFCQYSTISYILKRCADPPNATIKLVDNKLAKIRSSVEVWHRYSLSFLAIGPYHEVPWTERVCRRLQIVEEKYLPICIWSANTWSPLPALDNVGRLSKFKYLESSNCRI